jgi:hypothetical protein
VCFVAAHGRRASRSDRFLPLFFSGRSEEQPAAGFSGGIGGELVGV